MPSRDLVLFMTNDLTAQTAISEPDLLAGEAEMLLFALDRSRARRRSD